LSILISKSFKMLPQNILLALVAAMSVTAVPLNINLGAYSPALVVGDGEISFGGAQGAGELMETLATGAAANAAAAEGQQQGGAEGEQPPPPAEEAAAGEGEGEAAAEGEVATASAGQAIDNGLNPGALPNMAKRDFVNTFANLVKAAR
jgi:hypothetical protein